MEKLELDNLREELKGSIDLSYAQKRMFGEIQKKINEIIDYINSKKDQLL